ASSEDIDKLRSLSNSYSYAQFIHILIAKIATEINDDNKDKLLTKAAIYTSDRSILKSLLTEASAWPAYEAIEEQEPTEERSVEPVEIAEETENIISDRKETSDDIYKDVFENLEKLRSLRKEFEFLETAQADENKKQPAVSDEDPDYAEDDEETVDQILDSITKRAEIPAADIDEKKKEQINIIDNFINNAPDFHQRQLAAKELAKENNKDLAENSTALNDDLISENLALIFLKQGKKERAIDIYSKLILKYPHKKAYFATQIEQINQE
ncbi:MAG: hypothetical protein ACFCUU_03405, partial [Cyclobacteriaceae bacterium]